SPAIMTPPARRTPYSRSRPASPSFTGRRRSVASGVMIAGEREQTRDVREVLRAQVGVDRVPLEVVVAVGQPQAALGDRDRVAVGILLVEVDPDAQRRLEREVRAAHEPRQLLVSAGVAD